jgi:hypothetical protein
MRWQPAVRTRCSSWLSSQHEHSKCTENAHASVKLLQLLAACGGHVFHQPVKPVFETVASFRRAALNVPRPIANYMQVESIGDLRLTSCQLAAHICRTSWAGTTHLSRLARIEQVVLVGEHEQCHASQGILFQQRVQLFTRLIHAFPIGAIYHVH